MLRIKKFTKITNGFRRRGGISVLSSGILVKIISAIVAIVVARFLPKEEYGNIAYALTIITLVNSFSGAGMDRALLRYGALSKNRRDRNLFYWIALRDGLIVSFVLIFILWVFNSWIVKNQPGAKPYLFILCLLIVTEFLYKIVQVIARVNMENRIYAIQGFIRSVLLLILSVPAVLLLKGYGYAWTIVITPIIAISVFPYNNVNMQELFITSRTENQIDLWEYHKFGLMVGFGAVLTRLHTLIDSLFVANLLANPALLAVYRVAAIIPSHILFIPQIYFRTEYVYMTKQWNIKKRVNRFLKYYLFLSSVVSASLISFGYIYSKLFMELLFGQKYFESAPIFLILLIGISAKLVLQQPFGNLLTMSGKANIGFQVGIIGLILDIVLLLLLIPKYSLQGAAFATAISMWVRGLLLSGSYYMVVYRHI